MGELRDRQEPPLPELLARLSPVDLILIEGYRREGHPKIETFRSETGKGLLVLAENNPTIRAIASDSAHDGLALPVFDLNDTGAIADFIIGQVGL